MYKPVGKRCIEELLPMVEDKKQFKNIVDVYSNIALKRAMKVCDTEYEKLKEAQGIEFDEHREDKILKLQKCNLFINEELKNREMEKVKQEVEPKTIKTTEETFKKGKKYRIKTWDELLKDDENFVDYGYIFHHGEVCCFDKKMKSVSNEIFVVKDNQKFTQIRDWLIYPWMCEEVEEVQPLEEFEIGKIYEILTYNELLKIKGAREESLGMVNIIKCSNKEHHYAKLMDDITARRICPVSKNVSSKYGWEIEPWMCVEVKEITLEDAFKLEKIKGEFKNPNEEYVSTDLEPIELAEKGTSTVNHPQHYNVGSIETIDVIESLNWGKGFNLGNALKYLMRCEHKGKKKEDLEKAMWYIKRELKNIEEEK